jgi:hypothetical protein
MSVAFAWVPLCIVILHLWEVRIVRNYDGLLWATILIPHILEARIMQNYDGLLTVITIGP